LYYCKDRARREKKREEEGGTRKEKGTETKEDGKN